MHNLIQLTLVLSSQVLLTSLENLEVRERHDGVAVVVLNLSGVTLEAAFDADGQTNDLFRDLVGVGLRFFDRPRDPLEVQEDFVAWGKINRA